MYCGVNVFVFGFGDMFIFLVFFLLEFGLFIFYYFVIDWDEINYDRIYELIECVYEVDNSVFF